MQFSGNLSSGDRIVRFAIAAVCGLAGFLPFGLVSTVIFWLVGIVLFIEAIIGWCALYAILGWSTIRPHAHHINHLDGESAARRLKRVAKSEVKIAPTKPVQAKTIVIHDEHKRMKRRARIQWPTKRRSRTKSVKPRRGHSAKGKARSKR